jgi:diketogulonate reductase-like aldo/keto reductase
MELPNIGFGTYQLKQTYQCVRWALEIGYRHIDTATLYKNEKQVGQAIRDSGISREEIFITTKIPLKAIRKSQLLPAIESSLQKLDVGYIDLMLLHSPESIQLVNQTWEKFSKLYSQIYKNKLIRQIGVSNYRLIHLTQLKGIKPYANQIEVTPFIPRKTLREYCQNQGISIIAHSSLTKGIQLNNQQLLEIITKNDEILTSSSLLLKWALQNNIKILPRSSNQKHILANFKLSSKLLSEQIMKSLDNLDCGFATHPQHIT